LSWKRVAAAEAEEEAEEEEEAAEEEEEEAAAEAAAADLPKHLIACVMQFCTKQKDLNHKAQQYV